MPPLYSLNVQTNKGPDAVLSYLQKKVPEKAPDFEPHTSQSHPEGRDGNHEARISLEAERDPPSEYDRINSEIVGLEAQLADTKASEAKKYFTYYLIISNYFREISALNIQHY